MESQANDVDLFDELDIEDLDIADLQVDERDWAEDHSLQAEYDFQDHMAFDNVEERRRQHDRTMDEITVRQHNEQTQQGPDAELQQFLQSERVQQHAPPLTQEEARAILDVWQPSLPICPPPDSDELLQALENGHRVFRPSAFPISKYFHNGGAANTSPIKRGGGRLAFELPPHLRLNYVWKFEEVGTAKCFWHFGFSGKSTKYTNAPRAPAADSARIRSPSASNMSTNLNSNFDTPFSPASEMSVPETPEIGVYIQNDNNKRVRAEQGCRAAAAAEGPVENGPSLVDGRSVILDFTILEPTVGEQLPPNNLQDTAVNLLARTDVVEERVDDLAERVQRLEVTAGVAQQHPQHRQMNAPGSFSPAPANPGRLAPHIDRGLAADIVAYLQANPGSHRAVDIARNLPGRDLKRRKEVNPALYALRTAE
eukprot:GILK01003552.1.p1 GENE.GILK01003552.1~~GILK01003552.1.p1  ORF type:complete len:426 (+),score=70.43 GILK01003552.1:1675-2952(+)